MDQQDLKLVITGDSSGGKKAVDDLKASVDGLTKSLPGAGGAFANLTQGMSAAGRQAPVFADLITGMSQSGRSAMASLDKEGGISAQQFAAKLKSAFENPTAAARSLGSELGSSLLPALGNVSMGTVGIATGAIAVVAGMGKMATSALALADHLSDFAVKANMSVEEAYRLKYVADVTGTSMDQLGSIIFNVQRRMSNPTPDFLDGLSKIGLKIEDIKSMNGPEMLAAFSDGFRDNSKNINVAATSMELFGKQGKEYLPFLNKQIRDLVDNSKDLKGPTEADAKAAEEWNQAWNKVTFTVGNFLTKFGLKVVHFFQEERKALDEDIGAWKGYYNILLLVEGYKRSSLQQNGLPGLPKSSSTFGNAKSAAHPDTVASLGGDPTSPGYKATADYLDLVGANMNKQIEESIRLKKEDTDATKAREEAEKKAFTEFTQEWEFKQKAQDEMLKEVHIASQPGFLAGWQKRHVENLEAMGQQTLGPGGGKPGQFGMAFGVPGLGMKSATNQLNPSFLSAFDGMGKAIPNTIFQSLMGGGNPLGAVTGLVGKNMGEGIATKLAGSLTSKLGSFGGMAASALGGMATMGISLAAPLVMAGVKKLIHIGKPSKEELEARDAQSKVVEQLKSMATEGEKTEGALKDNYSTIAIVARDAFVNTGMSAEQAGEKVKDLLDTKHPEKFKAAMEDLNGVLARQKKAAEMLPQLLAKVTGGFNAIGQGLFASALTEFDKFKAKTQQFKDDPERMSREFQDSFTIPTQNALDRVGRLSVTAFHTAVAGGMSFTQAIEAIGPGLDSVLKGMNDFGGMTASPEFWGLIHLRDFTQGHKELMGAVDGVNQMMSGLHDMGLLTQQDFNDLNGVAFDTYKQMVDGGLAGTDAMRAMQPTLQAIWVQHHDNGLEIDANTAKLLSEAETQGLVGEHMKGVQQQTLDVLKAIAKVLGADIPNALKNLPKDTTLKVHLNADKTGDWEQSAGAITESIPSFANRPMERVTGAGYALLHPGDVVGMPSYGFGRGGGVDMNGTNDLLYDIKKELRGMPDMMGRAVRDAILLSGG